MGQKNEKLKKDMDKSKENGEMKKQIAKMKKKSLVLPRSMPAELLNEMFSSLPFENAFALFAKMPNWLLARNVRKMLKSIEMAMRNNKWNEADCGPELSISDGGRVVKHSSPNYGFNSVRAQMAIPKFNLNFIKLAIAYFEVEILIKLSHICIGFCTQQFPLELEGNWLGAGQNSIGICHKGGIFIDGKYNSFGNGGGYYFQDKVVIGIGIAHSPANFPKMKCFATLNGELLGMVDLPIKFADLELFPAVSMFYQKDSIRANFGQNEWRYNPREIVANL